MWRVKSAAEAGSEIIDQVGGIRGAIRRHNFKKKAEASVINTIDEPALAATVFFFSLANEKAAGNLAAKDVIADSVRKIVDEADLNETLVFGEWAAASVVEPGDLVRKFRNLWRQSLSPDQMQELLEMSSAVMNVGGEPTHIQINALKDLRMSIAN